jgi:hypothetical protein
MEHQEYPFEQPAKSEPPTAAGIWAWMIGGEENYTEADRRAGEALAETFPHLIPIARHSRAFQRRAVEHMVQSGIRQIVDVGTGMPVRVNTHDMAGKDVTVVYVDNDPLILTYARALLVGDRTAYVDADLTQPDTVLRKVQERVDLTRPTGVLILSTLGLINPPAKAAAIVQQYTRRLAPGSMLAVCDTLASPEVREAERVYAATGTTPYIARTLEEIRATADGLQILDPGIVPVTQWPTATDEPSQQYGFVAQVR